MKSIARVSKYVFAILLALIVVAATAAIIVIRRSYPQTNGTIQVAGLDDKVEVYRDAYGVPHIYAQNESDLFFAQGYVHAQDRFWQMEFWRHQSQGRLSEMLGEQTLGIDKFLRNVGFNRAAQNHLSYYQQNEPHFIALLEDYSRGVNAYIEENRGALAANITILGLVKGKWEIEPWTPLDTVAWGVAMAWDLKGSGNMESEQERAVLVQMLGEQLTSELLPFYPFDKRPAIVTSDEMASLPMNQTAAAQADLVSEEALQLDYQQLAASFIGEIPANGLSFGTGTTVGSNSWVVSGDYSETGEPLLANDPHLSEQMPSIWYEIGLHAPGWNVTGFSFAGAPGVVIGHNDRIAWGFTNVGPDVQDLFIEKLNPDNPLQYLFEDEWRDIETIEEVIKVNGGEDVTLQVHLTHHGPILNSVDERIDEVLSLRWTVFEHSRTMGAILMLDQAQNYQDFKEAGRNFDVPTQNLLYADVDGNIAYQTPGLIPIRPIADGLSPVPGWTGENEWQGWIPYESLPSVLNPEKGYIVTANNSVADEKYPYQVSLYWDNGDRAQRITDMIESQLAKGSRFTHDDFARMQFDSYSLTAADYVPLITSLSSSDNSVQEAIDLLSEWDYQERRESVPAALFEIFYMQFTRAVLADELGSAVDTFPLGTDAQRVFFHDLAGKRDSHYWDDVNSPEIESRDDMILKAMAEAIGWLETNLGGKMEDWQWGELHTVTFHDSSLGQSGIGPIEKLVNRGPYPVDGGSDIVNAASWSWDEPAVVGWLPSMRMIVDLSDLDASQSTQTTGQSGHPGHRHYDDMIELWANGTYHPMLFGREAVEANAEQLLNLQPSQ